MPVLIAIVVGFVIGWWMAFQDVEVPMLGPSPGKRVGVVVSAMADRMDKLEEAQRMCCDHFAIMEDYEH